MKFIIKDLEGDLKILDLPVSKLPALKGAIRAKSGEEVQDCIYLEAAKLHNDAKLADYLQELLRQSGQHCSLQGRSGDEHPSTNKPRLQLPRPPADKLPSDNIQKMSRQVSTNSDSTPSTCASSDTSAPRHALLFPDEGGQFMGMMEPTTPYLQDLLDQARSILGFDVRETCTLGPEFRLTDTRCCQPAMFIMALAAVEELKTKRPHVVTDDTALLGWGVGHYAALVAAGVLSFQDGLRIIKVRTVAMQEATASRQLSLYVTGLNEAQVAGLCTRVERCLGPKAFCKIGYLSGHWSMGVSGTEEAILAFKGMAKDAGASYTAIANVTSAGATPLMEPVKKRLMPLLREMQHRMQPPSKTVWSTTSSVAFPPGTSVQTIVDDLERHITVPVRWNRTISEMSRDGVEEFHDLGKKKILTWLMFNIDRGAYIKMKRSEKDLKSV